MNRAIGSVGGRAHDPPGPKRVTGKFTGRRPGIQGMLCGLFLAIPGYAMAPSHPTGVQIRPMVSSGHLYETSHLWGEKNPVERADTTDATLSALALATGSAVSVALSPSFHADSTAYRAFVQQDTAAITVTATENEDSATVAIAGDTDTTTPGTASVALSEGANTITITVSAQDGVTTRTYTITVARAASAPTADPDAVWTANLTVAVNGTVLGYNKTDGTGALAPRSFMVGDSTFTVTQVEYDALSNLLPIGFEDWFLLNAILYLGRWGVVLHLGDAVMDFREGIPSVPELEWEFGDVVLLKLFTNTPDKVTGVQVTTGNEQLDVEWEKPPAAEGYKVQWKSGSQTFADAAMDGREATIADEDTTTYTIPNLTNGTEYLIRVIATNDAGDGDPSDVESGIPLTTPGKVTGLTVTAGDGLLALAWTRPSLAFGYKVQWKSGTQTFSDAVTDNRQRVLSEGTPAVDTITGLTNGREYTVRVIATNAVADGVPSDEATGTPLSSDATLSSLTLVTGGGVSVALSPAFDPDSTTYRVVVHNDTAVVTVTATKADDGASVVIADDTDTATPGTATLALTEGGNTITVTLTAEDTVTTKTYMITVVRAAPAPTPDPSAVWTANLTVGTDHGTGLLGYHAANGAGALAPRSFVLNDTTFTVSQFEFDPEPKQLRIGYVERSLLEAIGLLINAGAVLHIGTGVIDFRGDLPSEFELDWAFGDVVLLKLFANAPEKVTGVGLAAGDEHLEVSWDKPTAARGYKVQWKSGTQTFADAAADGRQAILDHPDSTSYTIPNLTNGTQYMVRVIATNDTGDATASDVKSGTPNPASSLPWYTTMTVGNAAGSTRGYDATGGTLGNDDFRHGAESYKVTAVRLEINDNNSVLGVVNQGTGSDSLPHALDWEVAGIELPLDEIASSASDGRYRYSQSWLATNAPFLHHTNVLRAVTVGTGVTVCLRTAMQNCPANTAASGKPTISGTATVGGTLTASTGTIADADGLTGVTYGYQWFRVDPSENETTIGTNSATYAPVTADVGNTIKVRMSFLDAGGFGEMLTSDATASVSTGNSATTGQPTIAGVVVVGALLTATKGTIADADGLTNADNGVAGYSYTYQWVRVDGANEAYISGATSHTYTLADADEGKRIKVRASFTDDADYAESRTSAPTATVAAAPTVPVVNMKSESGAVNEGVTVRFQLWVDPVATSQLVVSMSWSQQGSFWARRPPSTVTLAAGDTLAEVEVPTVDDNTQEANGSITAEVRSGNGYEVGSHNSVTTEVHDNDGSEGICSRTPAVRDRILTLLRHRHSYKGDCSGVTDDDLAQLTSLDVDESSLTSLRSGDFAGLTALTYLSLMDNRLATLPRGVFGGLAALEELRISDNDLVSPLDGVFVDLPALEKLTVYGNNLTGFPFYDLETLPSLTGFHHAGNPGVRYKVQISPLRVVVDTSAVEYRVRLMRPPGGDAVVISRHTPNGVGVTPQTRSFNRTNWFRSQAFTVRSTAELGETGYITHSVNSGYFPDPAIDSVAVTKVAALVVSSEAEALALVAGLSPREAAAVLFGEAALDPARLQALDLLGNRNGRYDHGDLIAWLDRCRRGDADCRDGGDPAPHGSAPPPKSQEGTTRRRSRGGRTGVGPGGRSGRCGDGSRGMPSGPAGVGSSAASRRRSSGLVRAAVVAGLAAWACMGEDLTRLPTDGSAAPQVDQPLVRLPGAHDGGRPLEVSLTNPSASRDIGAMLWLEGPAIDSVQAPGLTLFASAPSISGGRRVVVAGDLSVEAILRIWVPAGSDAADYRVEVLEVSGEDYSLQDPGEYSASVRR